MWQRSQKWDLGVGISYGYSYFNNDLFNPTFLRTETNREHSQGLSFISRRWLVKNERLSVFIQPSARVQIDRYIDGLDPYTYRELAVEVAAPLGLAYNINDRFRVTGLLNVLSVDLRKPDFGSGFNLWQHTVNLTSPDGLASIGFEYLIP
jgi:hypothetical protein